jgi:septal ring factor EnvC (AmiA/AmiB activator)
MPSEARRRLGPALLATLLLLVCSVPAAAQDLRSDLRDSQLRLDSIRAERTRLQRDLEQIQSRLRDASRELTNIGRQHATSLSALREIEFQAAMLQESIEDTREALIETREQHQRRSTALNLRLREIYKRGPMHTVRVLLTAESFGDLLSRYRYLHLITQHERRMVQEIAQLEGELARQERSLRESIDRLDELRVEKEAEVASLRLLEERQNRAMRQVQQEQTRTATSLEALARDEARLSSLVADLERRRIEEDRRAAATGRGTVAGAISTRSLGSLNWPVDGDVIYRFGPERRPNGITLRNNGIGIAAPAGSSVRAVEAGTVTMSRPFEGYGPTVMISHGGGYYTLYLYLQSIHVVDGQQVTSGQQIGTVGGAQTPEGARVEFRVMVPLQGGPPQPVDPLDWLRSRSGGR